MARTGAGLGFFSDRRARREAAEAQAASDREARAREEGLSVEELLHEWRGLLSANGVDIVDIRCVFDASGGTVFRESFDASKIQTSVDRGLILVVGSGKLVFAFRASPAGDAPPPAEVIVRSVTEVREPRKREDRGFIIRFEKDGLFGPPHNPMRADAWELRHSDPDELYRRFSSAGLPW